MQRSVRLLSVILTCFRGYLRARVIGRFYFTHITRSRAAQLDVEADAARLRPAGRAGSESQNQTRRYGACIASLICRQAPRRSGFGTRALAAQLNV